MSKIIAQIKKEIRFYLRPVIFKIKKFYKRQTIGREGTKKEFTLNKNIEWFGTDYGGFFLDKTLISKKSILFSFGVGTDISFDLGVADLGVRQIYLFDPTPKAIDFIKEFKLPRYYKFFSFGLSDKDETTKFFLPAHKEYISGSVIYHDNLGKGEEISVDLKKLSSICEDLKINAPDILKMDIEGSEFKVIRNFLECGIFPKQICIEFHSRFFEDGMAKLEESLKLLNENGYIIGGKSIEEEYLFIKNN